MQGVTADGPSTEGDALEIPAQLPGDEPPRLIHATAAEEASPFQLDHPEREREHDVQEAPSLTSAAASEACDTASMCVYDTHETGSVNGAGLVLSHFLALKYKSAVRRLKQLVQMKHATRHSKQPHHFVTFIFHAAADKRPPPSSQDDFQSQQPVRKKAHVTIEPEKVPDTVHTVDSEVRAAVSL